MSEQVGAPLAPAAAHRTRLGDGGQSWDSRLSAYSVQELRTISTHWDLRHSDDLCASKVPLPYELISEIQRGAEPEVLNSVAQ